MIQAGWVGGVLAAATVAALAGGAGENRAPNSPLLVRAWIKQRKPKTFPTRTLDHLNGFASRPVRLGPYGGWADKKQKATGFFHTRRIAGRWWLIDPQGLQFLHLAVNSVRPGRGPQMRKAFARTFRTPAGWARETTRFLKAHGFNGTGSWSDDETNAKASCRVAYTPNWNFMSSYGRLRGGTRQVAGHKAYPNDCIFVFDPAFETFADQHARKLARTKEDPFLLGHFSDNELPLKRDLLDKALKLPATDATYRAATAWLAQRRRGRANPRTITDEDREAWRGHVAETYFAICARAIRKHDPNHLYLGSRLYGSEKRSRAVIEAAGRHLDVLAVNVYGVWTPGADMLGRWASWSARPVLVTEWYAKGADSGLANRTGAGWTVPTQADRGRFYQNFTLALLESRCCVGWHWFKYQDNDPSDPSTDPSNRDSNKGIVTASYEPYRPLLRAMKQLNEAAYPLTEHFDRGRIAGRGGAKAVTTAPSRPGRR